MRVVNLQAENLKRLKAIDITPSGNIVSIGGKNGAGKSTVLDAIYIAIKGRRAAPPRPIREGEEECIIRLDLGDVKVTRKFKTKDGGEFTDTLKVENAEGMRFPDPQKMLNALLGEIGFDPFAFVNLKPEQQVAMLLQMVPLSIDLDDMADEDASDFARRRDTNRDVASLAAQVDAIPKETVPDEAPDREALTEALGRAADTNIAIDREAARRGGEDQRAKGITAGADRKRERAFELRKEADQLVEQAESQEREVDTIRAELAALPALDERVNTEAVRAELRTAEATLATIDRQRRRAGLESQLATKRQESEGFTAAMAARKKERNDALAKAKMPIEGLAFSVSEGEGKVSVLLDGVPFEQGSKAQKLKASTAIAMAANPTLRVLRIEDGSLLDDESLAILTALADTEDYQLWCEFVGTHNSAGEAVGIILEDGTIKGAEPVADVADEKPKVKKAKAVDKPDGALL